MSRSDGSFPSYVKMDLDPQQPRPGWNKGCRRCSNCGRNWPNVAVFSPSPCHDVDAGIVSTSAPDMTWSVAVHELLDAKFEKYYDRWNEGLSDEELYWTVDSSTSVSESEINEGMKEIENLLIDRQPHM